MKNKLISIFLFIVGLIITIAPLNTDCLAVGHVMPNGMPMMCHYTAISYTVLGIIVILLSLASFFIKKAYIVISSYILQFCVGGFGLLVLNGIVNIGNGVSPMKGGWKLGMCGIDTMSCHTTMEPIAKYAFVFIAVISIIGIIVNILKKEK